MADEPVLYTRKQDLRLTIAALEAEYRVYRQAVERFHSVAETGFGAVRNLLSEQIEIPEAASASAAGSLGSSGVSVGRARLTDRERQVLTLIAGGYSTKQAAAALGIRFKTAAGHRSQMMKKLGIHDTASLVRYAIRTRLVEP